MFVCLDVHYSKSTAYAAAIGFFDWESDRVAHTYQIRSECTNEYQAGEFYLRELPHLVTLIKQIHLKPKVLIIDAYCYLSEKRRLGLGAHLSREFSDEIPVIGVAKNRFQQTTHAIEVFRGKSIRPLFVTSIGISQSVASSRIESMHGKNRFPTLLKAVDNLARQDAKSG